MKHRKKKSRSREERAQECQGRKKSIYNFKCGDPGMPYWKSVVTEWNLGLLTSAQ